MPLALGQPWTPAEYARVRDLYPRRSQHRALQRALPGRTWLAIKLCAKRLRVHVEGAGAKRRWTTAEDATLRRSWQAATWPELQRRLPGRTRPAIYDRATLLGLPKGVPQGYVSVAEAARRERLEGKTLRKLLAAANVTIRHILGIRRGVTAHRGYVDLDEVRAVLAARFNGEALPAAAAKRGLCVVTLREWLQKAGAFPRGIPGKRVCVPTATIDAVVAAHRAATARPTIAAFAARYRVNRYTLTHWLRRAGLLAAPGTGNPHRLDPADVARVVAARRQRKAARARTPARRAA